MDKVQKLLEVKDLTVHYVIDNKTVRAVEHLNLNVSHGETLGLIGETGAGKTTTALAIMGILPDPPSKIIGGEIIFEGEDLLKKKPKEMREIRGQKISMIFQDPMTSLNPVITVKNQIAEMIELHGMVSKKEAIDKAIEMLGVVGIGKERANDYPHQFSGGMKQRVIIAMALACNPSLIIADEPTTALDVTIQAQVLELMKDLKKQYKTSMIMITHDLGIVAEICDKAAIMYAGNIVEYSSTRSIYRNPLHPYTIGLFNSIPDLDSEQDELNVIDGMLPDPTNLPSGCAFHPRCPKAKEKCAKMKPENIEVESGHYVKCFLFHK